MKIEIFLPLILSLLSVSIGNAQTKKTKKPNLYVYFEVKMRGEHEVSTYKSDLEEYGRYIFEVWEPRKRTIYNTVNKDDFKLVDSNYLKSIKVMPSDILVDIHNFVLDAQTMRSKKYHKVFIVEKLESNQFKIIEIVGYMGDIFFAPERRKNPDH